jgi:hypothetical protein
MQIMVKKYIFKNFKNVDSGIADKTIHQQYVFITNGKVKKLKVSRYMSWRHMGGEEVSLLLILNLGTRWG